MTLGRQLNQYEIDKLINKILNNKEEDSNYEYELLQQRITNSLREVQRKIKKLHV